MVKMRGVLNGRVSKPKTKARMKNGKSHKNVLPQKPAGMAKPDRVELTK